MAIYRVLSFLLFFLFSIATAGEPAGAAPEGGGEAVRESLSVSMYAPKGFFQESCLELGEGQTLRYRISTPYPVDFDVHHHPETGPTVFPDQRQVESRHAAQVTATAAGTYCFTVSNPEARPKAFEIVIDYEVIGN